MPGSINAPQFVATQRLRQGHLALYAFGQNKSILKRHAAALPEIRRARMSRVPEQCHQFLAPLF